MPVEYFDSPTIPLTYDELTNWAVVRANNQGHDIISYLNYVNNNYPDADLTDFMIQETSDYMDFYQNADGTYTVLGYKTDFQDVSYTNPIDSNSSTISRGNFRQMLNHGVENVGGAIKRHITPYPSSGSFGQRASYVLGSVGGAIGAASTGITLGKLIAPRLYDLNPNFWESIGVSQGSFDPENWNSITNGDDSPFAGLFNMILGLNPDTGQGQMYMDEKAFAYMAYAMKEAGVFSQAGRYVEETPENFPTDVDSYIPFSIGSGLYVKTDSSRYIEEYMWTSTAPIIILGVNDGSKIIVNMITSLAETGTVTVNQTRISTNKSTGQSNTFTGSTTLPANSTYTFDSKTIYSDNTVAQIGSSSTTILDFSGINIVTQSPNSTASQHLAWLAYYNYVEHGGIDGIGNQEGATLPDTTGWNDLDDVLSSLQNQYPNLWNDGLTWDSLQPDGTVNQTKYIPVAMPNLQYNNDQQPTSGDATQTNTILDTTTLPKDFLQQITDLITAPKTQTQPETQIPPANPTDTGIGDTPVPTAPTGSASALWSVYHPTQAQINSFGAWLWGSPFLTNIGKLFQNPIDGVISLHKIYATPIDSGTGNIVVGTLDSNVSSATVNQQYVDVDCGSVSLSEDFGNVFDYDPYTRVSLYLPFIGIVALNVSDVMRSTIHVVYGVDVFTGACIAMVEVSRDGCDANLYQYTGNCAVHYPLSNVQQSQLLSGLITIGAGVGAIIATGGTAAPAAATGIASGIGSALHSNIGRSGGFSANAGAMGIKIPYLIIERPQTKVADTFPLLDGYPTNYSVKLGNCSNHVVCKTVHVGGISATKSELEQIETLLKSGVEV